MAHDMGRVDEGFKPVLPWGRRLAIRMKKKPKYTGNLIIPSNVKSMVPTTGIVAALGFELQEEMDRMEVPWVKVGDQVVYSRYGGVELTFADSQTVLVIHADDVLATISGDESLSEEPETVGSAR